jgi:Flp pilus assembly protein TadD
MADRYAYLPLAGLCVTASWSLGNLAAATSRRGVSAAAALAVLALAATSSMQTRHWANSSALFEHARRVTGDNWLAEYSLGNEAWRLGRGREAQELYRMAIRLNPAFAEAHNNLGALLLLEGKTAAAIPVLEQAARLSPRDPALRFNLGLALEKVDPRAAASSYREALRLKPDYSEARVRLEILRSRGKGG